MTHPYKCPNCGAAINATNIEYLYEEHDHVVPNELQEWESALGDIDTYDPLKDRRQLWYCPNEDCRIVRLFPGESDE